MVELNEKAIEAARNAIRADDVGDPLRLSDPALDTALGRVIRAYLAALPAPDDGLVERLRYRVENPSAWDTFDQGGSDLIAEAATALRSKDEQIQRLTHNEAETFQKYVDANEARLDAEQQVQKLSAENERLREALSPFSSVAEHDIGEDEDDADIFWPISNSRYSMAGRLRVGHLRAARSALETQEGGK